MLYCLICGTGDASFRNRLQAQVVPVFFTPNHLREDIPEREYYMTVFTSILLTNFHFWYEHREQYTLEEITCMDTPLLIQLVCKLRERPF